MPKVTIYSDIDGFPHSFLGTTDNDGNTIYRGFYPEKTGLAGKGQIKNEINKDGKLHEFQYSKDIEITDEQYAKLVDRIEADKLNPPFYDLPAGSQCSVWVADVLADAGVIDNFINADVNLKEKYVNFYSNLFGDKIGKTFGGLLGTYIGWQQTLLYNPYTQALGINILKRQEEDKIIKSIIEKNKSKKEQQMDKNITSPTSSLTKPVMLASSNSVATDGFVDYGVSNDAFSTLQIANEANDKFIVTRANINESLEDIFSIECFAYINLVKNPLYENLESIYNDNAQTGIYRYLDKGMKLSIKRPSSTNKSIIPSNSGSDYIYFSGIVSDVEYLGVDDDSSTNIDKKYFFKFKLTSSLYRLSINRANRIYTDQSVLEVVKEILSFNKQRLTKELDFSNIKNSYNKKEFIAQYNESDLAFITRLCHDSGIYFYEDNEKIYFHDTFILAYSNQAEGLAQSGPSKGKEARKVSFNVNLNNNLASEHINKITKSETLKANSFTHSFQNTAYPNVLESKNEKIFDEQVNIYDKHINLDEYSFSDTRLLEVSTYLKKLRSDMLLKEFIASSNVFALNLNDNISVAIDQSSGEYEFKIIAIKHTYIDESVLENTLNLGDNVPLKDKKFISSYTNELSIIPSSVKFVPSYKQKPKAPDITLGLVVGQDGLNSQTNTIHTDSYGRVKVRLNAFSTQEQIDKDDTINASYHKSAYLRVITPIASNSSGFFAIPRIGDEVIISFLQNDIDNPVVSGSLYNASNMPLVNVDNNYHQTSLSSKTIGANETGINEITLSNLKNKEQIYVKAEKDYDELVNNDFSQTILNDKSSQVHGSYTERVKKAHIQTIDLAKNVNVGGEYLTTVGLSKDTVVGVSNTLNVAVDDTTRVGQDRHEFVGNDKFVEIKSNLNTTIHNDETKEIKGTKEQNIDGSYKLNSQKGINEFSNEHIVLQANNYIDINAKSNFTTKTAAQHTEMADSKFSEIETTYEVNAKNEIIHQVGSTKVTINGASVVIEVGGIKAIFDSMGLRVIGGDIKAL